MNNRQILAAFAALVCAVIFLVPGANAEILPSLVKEGAKIAFLGDSITAQGARPNGYVDLTLRGLAANGIEPEAIKAGVGGNKSNNMRVRLERDILRHKPSVMTLSCGVNDVWHGERGISLEDYKANIGKIVADAQAAGCEVVIMTATMIRENPDNEANQKLALYNAYLRELAKEKNCRLADTNAAMIKRVVASRAAGTAGNTLTTDGVHMNPAGNRLMAETLLRSLGLDEKQMETALAAWDAGD